MLVTVAKGLSKLPNLHILIKQKSPSLPRSLAQVSSSVLNKGKSAIPPLFNGLELLPSVSDKANCFLRTLILIAQVSLSLFSLLELIQNYIIFVTPMMAKRS